MEFWKAGHLINLATKILPKPDLLNAFKPQNINLIMQHLLVKKLHLKSLMMEI